MINDTFFESISKLLVAKLNKLTEEKKSLNGETCTAFYTEIFESIVEIFQESKVQISNEGMNYVAQQFYDGVLINGKHPLDPNIFDKRAKLENIKTKEVAFIATLFKGTDFAIESLQEIKKRS